MQYTMSGPYMLDYKLRQMQQESKLSLSWYRVPSPALPLDQLEDLSKQCSKHIGCR
jgi:hypothetical protein